MTQPDIKNELIEQGEIRNSLAFRGRSRAIYDDAIRQVRAFGQNPIYSPLAFPSWRNPEPSTSLTRESGSSLAGELSPAEATAVVVLLNESAALNSALFRSIKISNAVHNVLGLPEGGWQPDAVEGLSQFGGTISSVAGVRQRLISGEGRPQGKTIGDHMARVNYDRYQAALVKDGLVISRNTSAVIVEAVSELAQRDIKAQPEGAKNETEIQARIDSFKHGAKLGEKLYLEILDRASKELSTDTRIKEVIIESPKQLSS